MFMAVILESFGDAEQEEKMRVKPSAIEKFTQFWKEYDPDATGLIAVGDLQDLLFDLLAEENSQVTEDDEET
jgi:Ca2+-binding EF-hand superfamily protein